MFFVFLLSLTSVYCATTPFETVCDSSFEFFDSSSLSCRSCPSNSYPDLDSFKSGQTVIVDPYGNALTCQCDNSYEKIESSCSTAETTSASCDTFYCSPCSSNVTYSEHSSCTLCGNSTIGLGNDFCACQNAESEMLYDTDASGDKLSQIECTACPSGSVVVYDDVIVNGHEFQASEFKCQTCSTDSTMSLTYSDSTYDCECISSYTEVGVTLISGSYCVLTNEYETIPTNDYNVKYDTGMRLSLAVMHYYPLAAVKCSYFRWPDSITACQLLANLCALSSSTSCDLYSDLYQGRSSGMSRLTFTSAHQDSVPVKMSFDPALLFPINYDDMDDNTRDQSSMLRFVSSTYSLNGTWLGYQDASLLFYYCNRLPPYDLTSSSSSWIIFGNSKSASFDCDVSSLSSSTTTTIFHDLFLIDETTGDLIPVPIMINNQLISRFYLIDVDSGLSSGTIDYRIRYASSIKVSIKSKSTDAASIYTPLVSIEYSSVSTFDSVISINFSVDYHQDMNQFITDVTAVFIFLLVVIFIISSSRFNHWTRRNNRSTQRQTSTNQAGSINYEYWFNLIMICMESFVAVIFPFVLLVTSYLFAYFKLQKEVFILLPSSSSSSIYSIFYNIIHILFVFQLFVVLSMIIKQSMCQVLLVDWESSSSTTSVWRSITALNEWNELSTMRKTSLKLTLIIVLFIMFGCQLSDYACAVPGLTSTCSPINYNMILSFVNCTWWLIIISIMQILIRYCLIERYLTDRKEHSFIDLCTIAKISLIILDEPYHGYYLHCRSPHSKADTTMADLIEKLSKEESGLTSDRSLDGAPDDVQMFEIFVTDVFMRKISKIRKKYLPSSPATSMETIIGDLIPFASKFFTLSSAKLAKPEPESIGKYMNCTNQFLREFIDSHSDRVELTRQIQERSRWERFLNIPPDMTASSTPNIFIPDLDFNFSETIFLGCEFKLLLFNILSFAVVNLWSNNAAVAAFVTWLFNAVLLWMRSELGKKNLARTTLIDERFLI